MGVERVSGSASEEWTLAGYLAQTGFLARQSEVLCTHGLAYLLEDPAASAAMAGLLSRTGVGPVPVNLAWLPEVSHESGGRVDLEGRTGDNAPVVIEAKLSAALGPAQLLDYASHLAAQGADNPVLAVLVPLSRVDEAAKVIRGAFDVGAEGPVWQVDNPRVTVAVVTWEQTLETIAGALEGRRAEDAAQLRGMYRTFTGDFRTPCGDTAWRENESKYIALVDRATRSLFGPQAVYPMALEPGHRGEYGYRRRYAPSDVSDATSLSVGVRDAFEPHTTPIWLRYHHLTPGFADISVRLRHSPLRDQVVWDGGHAWFPLEPLECVLADEAVADLVRLIQEIDQIAAN